MTVPSSIERLVPTPRTSRCSDAQDPAAHRPEKSRVHFLGLVPLALPGGGLMSDLCNPVPAWDGGNASTL